MSATATGLIVRPIGTRLDPLFSFTPTPLDAAFENSPGKIVEQEANKTFSGIFDSIASIFSPKKSGAPAPAAPAPDSPKPSGSGGSSGKPRDFNRPNRQPSQRKDFIRAAKIAATGGAVGAAGFAVNEAGKALVDTGSKAGQALSQASDNISKAFDDLTDSISDAISPITDPLGIDDPEKRKDIAKLLLLGAGLTVAALIVYAAVKR